MAATVGLVGKPTAACVAPGTCQFLAEWVECPLLERVETSHDTILCTFATPDRTKALNLSTCACILAMFNGPDAEPVVRPYTPVSTNEMVGRFQLLVKVYDMGKMGQHLVNMAIGQPLNFKHIDKNVKMQYPFGKKHLCMLVGGTGITPMIQALHAILGTAGDETKVTLIFGNKKQNDILCKELLEDWQATFAEKLTVVHVLSDAADDASWTGEKGFMDRRILEAHCAPPSEDVLILVCGPPPMYNALCGPRDKPEELTGLLSEMNYSVSQVYKF